MYNKSNKSEISTRIKKVRRLTGHRGSLLACLSCRRVLIRELYRPLCFYYPLQIMVAAAGAKEGDAKAKDSLSQLLSEAYQTIDKAVSAPYRYHSLGSRVRGHILRGSAFLQAGKGILKANTAARRKAMVARVAQGAM